MRDWKSWTIIVGAFSVCAALIEPALADDTDADVSARKAEARQRLDRGNALLREKQFEGARGEYEAAYRAFPSPKIRLNIAEADLQLGDWAGAYRNYSAFLAETDPESELYKPASARKAEMEAKLAFLKLESPIAGARVRVNGRDEGETPLEAIPLNPGRHEVVAEKDGYERFEGSEVLTSGETKTMTLALVAAKPSAPLVQTRVAPPTESSSVLEQWWFWAIVGGVIVIGAGVAIAASTGGSDFLPSGELGASGTSTWERF